MTEGLCLSSIKLESWPYVVMCVCNVSTWSLRQENHELELGGRYQGRNPRIWRLVIFRGEEIVVA